MASDGTESLANRDSPIPVVQIHPADGETPKTDNGTSHRLSASKLKDKLESLGENINLESSTRMGDKMFDL